MLHRFADTRAKLESAVDPARDRLDHAHVGPFLDASAEGPGVGISPALIMSVPRST
jgi:hypothetical protein